MASLKELSTHIHNFLEDRPIMNKDNSDKRLGKLLADEGEELRERLRMNNGTIEIDLLALYEIADIIIFAITLLQKLGNDLDIIPTELKPENSQIQMLQKIQNLTGKVSIWAEDGLPREMIIQPVQTIVLYGTALIQSFGLNPLEICMEKLGHNMSRYPAKYFKEGFDYETQRRRSKEITASYHLEHIFYSPIHPEEENPIYQIRT